MISDTCSHVAGRAVRPITPPLPDPAAAPAHRTRPRCLSGRAPPESRRGPRREPSVRHLQRSESPHVALRSVRRLLDPAEMQRPSRMARVVRPARSEPSEGSVAPSKRALVARPRSSILGRVIDRYLNEDRPDPIPGRPSPPRPVIARLVGSDLGEQWVPAYPDYRATPFTPRRRPASGLLLRPLVPRVMFTGQKCAAAVSPAAAHLWQSACRGPA